MSEQRASYLIPDMAVPPSYVDVRYPDGALAFRLDAKRLVIEIQTRGRKHYFDLRAIMTQGIDNNRQMR